MADRRRRLLIIASGIAAIGGIVAVVIVLMGGGRPSTHRGLLGPVIAPPSGKTVNASPSGNTRVAEVSGWIQKERLPPSAVPGARLFAVAGCTACHTYAGSGGSNLNAPDLTAVGTHHLGVAFEVAHLKCPSCVNPGSPMPPFGSLGSTRLHQLAVFLEDSRGD